MSQSSLTPLVKSVYLNMHVRAATHVIDLTPPHSLTLCTSALPSHHTHSLFAECVVNEGEAFEVE